MKQGSTISRVYISGVLLIVLMLQSDSSGVRHSTAQITGVDQTLTQWLAVILEVITKSTNIGSYKFGVYAADSKTSCFIIPLV